MHRLKLQVILLGLSVCSPLSKVLSACAVCYGKLSQLTLMVDNMLCMFAVCLFVPALRSLQGFAMVTVVVPLLVVTELMTHMDVTPNNEVCSSICMVNNQP